MNEKFRKISSRISYITGTAWAFLTALSVIIIWAITGPIFQFSTTWQLVINTGTTIVTFLMVFLIQNTQNRDSRAIHIKLDELLKSGKGARTSLVNIEELPDEILDDLQNEFKAIQAKYIKRLEKNQVQTTNTDHLRHIKNVVSFVENLAENLARPLGDK